MKFTRYIRILHGQLVIIVLIILAGIKFLPPVVSIPRIEFILDSTITCASTFSGFTLTVVSILLSFSRSTLIEHLNKKGGTKELIFRYSLSLALGIVIILFCLWVGSTLTTAGEQSNELVLSKYNAITGASLAFAYLYNLISSGIYLLWTIALATTPVTLVSDESVEPKEGFNI